MNEWAVNFGWTQKLIHDLVMLFGADFASKFSFKETQIVRDDNEVSEICSEVVWSLEHKEGEGRRKYRGKS